MLFLLELLFRENEDGVLPERLLDRLEVVRRQVGKVDIVDLGGEVIVNGADRDRHPGILRLHPVASTGTGWKPNASALYCALKVPPPPGFGRAFDLGQGRRRANALNRVEYARRFR